MTSKKILIPLITVLAAVILFFTFFFIQKRSGKEIKTADLLESILNDRDFMVSLSLNSSFSHNDTEKWKNKYGTVKELLARSDAAKTVYRKYCKLFPNGREQGVYYSDGAERVVLCLLFSDDVYPKLSEKQKAEIGENPFKNGSRETASDSFYFVTYDTVPQS